MRMSKRLPVRMLLVGVGGVGQRFLRLTIDKAETLRSQLGLELHLVGVADSSGAAACPSGLDVERVIDLKACGKGMSAYPTWGQSCVEARSMVADVEADLLLEASPSNLVDGQPGLGCIETGLLRGMHVVTANKAPLVLAFPRLVDLAREQGVRLLYDATVAGGLPAVNLGQRDLAAARILRMEGVLNLTSNYILTRMEEDGLSYQEALADAQAAGHAETDPSLDVEGWDSASKLVILSHGVLRDPVALEEIEVEGITSVTKELLDEAASQGKRVKAIASADWDGEAYRYRVGLSWLDAGHPLAQLRPKQMAITYHTDISGSITAAIVEETPVPTASAMLRDVVDLYAD
jgi:homoserine dehydrogenase